MNRRQLIGLSIVGVALFSIIAGTLLVPRLLYVLPGQVRSRLPTSLHILIYTPLPAMLPTPVASKTMVAANITPTVSSNQDLDNAEEHVFSRGSTVSIIPYEIEPGVAVELPATPQAETRQIDLPEPPFNAQIDGVEIIAQKYNNCGPANLTMVLNFYGEEADQNLIGGHLKPNYEDRNVSPSELVDYVNNFSALEARIFGGGDLTVLRRILSAGVPVIIEKGLYLDSHEGWMGHYLTLTGYNDETRQFTSQDTFLGPWDNSGHQEAYSDIEKYWHQFNNVFILVYRPEEEGMVMSLLPEEYHDPIRMWQHAMEKAQQMVDMDKSNAFSWFNLGSSLTNLGLLTGEVDNFVSAANAFDKAREIGLPWRMLWYQFEPYQAYLVSGRISDVKLLTEAILIYEGGRNIEETYLYRGHALLADGDQEGARRAYQKALDLNPSYSAAQEAIDILN